MIGVGILKPTVKTTEEEILVELNSYGVIYNRENASVMLTSDVTPYAVYTKLTKELRRALNNLSFSLDDYE